MKPLRLNKPVQPKSTAPKIDPNDFTSFKEYQEYLSLFADANCNLHEELKPKPGKNAEIFTEVILKRHSSGASRRAPSIEKFPGKSPSGTIIKSGEPSRVSLDAYQGSRHFYRRSQDALQNTSGTSFANFSAVAGDGLGRSQEKFSGGANRNSSMVLSITGSQKGRSDPQQEVQAPKPYMIPLKGMTAAAPMIVNPSFVDPNGSSMYKGMSPIQEIKREEDVRKSVLPLVKPEHVVEELQSLIKKHSKKKKKSNQEIAPIFYDKTFIGSRRLQERHIVFKMQKGLLPRSKINASFG